MSKGREMGDKKVDEEEIEDDEFDEGEYEEEGEDFHSYCFESEEELDFSNQESEDEEEETSFVALEKAAMEGENERVKMLLHLKRQRWWMALKTDFVDMDMLRNRDQGKYDEEKNDLTALQKAVRKGENDKVKKILQNNRSLAESKDEKTGWTIIHVAAITGNLEALKEVHKLGERKVLKNLMLVKTIDGNTALHLAVGNGHEGAAYFLIQEQPRAAYECNKRGISPLMMAMIKNSNLVHRMTGSKLSKDTKSCLLQHVKKNLLAHKAIQNQHEDLALPVLEALMNGLPELMESQDEDGQTPFSFAAYHGRLIQVRYFCKEFSHIITEWDGTGSSPIHQAVAGGQITIVKEIKRKFPESFQIHVDKKDEILYYLKENKII